MHLASLVESVPLAASGTPVNIGDKGSSHSSRSSVSDLAAPQPPSPDDHNHHQHQQSKQRKGKRGRRNRNNSNSETESARSRSDSSSSAQQQELEAAAAAAVLSPSTGSVYGKYESAVMWSCQGFLSSLCRRPQRLMVRPAIIIQTACTNFDTLLRPLHGDYSVMLPLRDQHHSTLSLSILLALFHYQHLPSDLHKCFPMPHLPSFSIY